MLAFKSYRQPLESCGLELFVGLKTIIVNTKYHPTLFVDRPVWKDACQKDIQEVMDRILSCKITVRFDNV
jgi:hypothetical protein